MNKQCCCGGKMRHLDEDKEKFRRKCEKCQRVNEQRKRREAK